MIDFNAALAAAALDPGCRGIGTIGEKSLHLTLKYFFAPDPETHERPLGGFIADAVTEEGVFEIQTRGLSRLKPKLNAFLPLCSVTVVYPVAASTLLCCVDENGELLHQRKSPKHETVFTAMREIYTLRDALTNPNLRICVVSVDVAGYLYADLPCGLCGALSRETAGAIHSAGTDGCGTLSGDAGKAVSDTVAAARLRGGLRKARTRKALENLRAICQCITVSCTIRG